MKIFVSIFLLLLTFSSCKNRKPADDPATFPKDVALRPDRQVSGKTNEEILAIQESSLRNLQGDIDSLINAHVCTDASEWRISALGSKPCGGPATYVVYQIQEEEVLLSKIREFTKIQAEYNRLKQIFSDCALEPQPSGIRCEDGKAILLYGENTIIN